MIAMHRVECGEAPPRTCCEGSLGAALLRGSCWGGYGATILLGRPCCDDLAAMELLRRNCCEGVVGAVLSRRSCCALLDRVGCGGSLAATGMQHLESEKYLYLYLVGLLE